MNISGGILDYLKKYGKVAVPEFGIFSTENSRAILDDESKTILPPAKQIYFEKQAHSQDQRFINFLASKEHVSLETAQSLLKAQTDYWKKLLQNKETFSIEELGDFYTEDQQLIFKGNRIQQDAPDFYGLEEINISDIKNEHNGTVASIEEEKGDYQFNNSILWFFLLVLPLLGITYFVITQPEKLFGKKSFDNFSVKNGASRIEKKELIENVSSKLEIIADSLKQDSLTKEVAIPPKTNTEKKISKK